MGIESLKYGVWLRAQADSIHKHLDAIDDFWFQYFSIRSSITRDLRGMVTEPPWKIVQQLGVWLFLHGRVKDNWARKEWGD